MESNVGKDGVLKTQTTFGGGMWPGYYEYNRAFDWNILKFSADSQVRIVASLAVNSKKIAGIKSVFFGERSRYGILIKVANSTDFGVEEQYLTNISENVAVVCRVRD